MWLGAAHMIGGDARSEHSVAVRFLIADNEDKIFYLNWERS